MEPEIPKEKPQCTHRFQIVSRVDRRHFQQVCAACRKVIFSWRDEFKDVRSEENDEIRHEESNDWLKTVNQDLRGEIDYLKKSAEAEFQRAESIAYNKRWFQEELVKKDMEIVRLKEENRPETHQGSSLD